jgi:hypothetical protein
VQPVTSGCAPVFRLVILMFPKPVEGRRRPAPVIWSHSGSQCLAETALT